MDFKELVNKLDTDQREEVIEFLCYMLTDNVDCCPGAQYNYKDSVCNECPGHDIDEESMRLCWLELAINDTGVSIN